MKIRSFLLIGTTFIYTNQEASAINWANFASSATDFVDKNIIPNNPQAQQQLGQASNFVQQNAGNVLSGAGSSLQNTAQTFWTQNGTAIQQDLKDKNFSGILTQGQTLAKDALNTGQTYAQQQQGVLQNDYGKQYGFTQDQVTNIVKSLSTLDTQYGQQVQTLNPQWRIAYGQTQYSLTNTQLTNTDSINSLMTLAQNQLQAIPTLITKNGSLTPVDSTWKQLKDVNGNLYDLSGNSLQKTPASPYAGVALIQIPGVTFTQSQPQVPQTQVPQAQVPQPQVPQTQVPQAQVPQPQQPTPVQAAATLQSLYTAYNQSNVTLKLPLYNPAIMSSISTTYNTLYSTYNANPNDPALTNLVKLANKQINNIQTIISANGVLVPTADWAYLINQTTNAYQPTN